MKRSLRGIWLGRRRYEPIYALQKRLLAMRQARALGDVVLLLEHEPVITLGRGADAEHLLVPRTLLAERGIDVAQSDRGGDVTVHGPGQLVGYPIIDLSPDRCDVRRYVRDLAEAMRRVVESRGISAGTIPELIGLWVDPEQPASWPGAREGARYEKIGAIGVRISRWVTMHGFALNLTTDLDLFELIVPCGISQHGVTSIERLTGERLKPRDAASEMYDCLASIFEASTQPLLDWSAVLSLEEAFTELESSRVSL